MQAKRKVLLGIFLFVVGIVLFILFVPDEGIFQILISNDILSIALGIVFFSLGLLLLVLYLLLIM
ncbi:MAG: hypothetical protein L6U99_08930 [Clostridium sp.]|nr:MAG: hypothetical protein L6U99_08930 [Clostridium sp.]